MADVRIQKRLSLPRMLQQAYLDWRADFATSMGAALAYYTIFAMAPIIVIAIAAAGLIFNEHAIRGEVFTQLRSVIGDDSAAFVQQLVIKASSPRESWIATIVGIVTMIVASTTIFGELQNDLDRIWKATTVVHSGFVTMLRVRLMSFVIVLGIGVLMLASLVLTSTISVVGHWWSDWFGGWSHIVQAIDLVASFVLSWGLFAMIYKLLPSCDVAWRDVWTGALATSLLFTLGKLAISAYLAHSSVTAMYGAAGSIALVLLWVYYAAQVFLFGAEFTHVYAVSHGSLSNATPPAAGNQPDTANPSPGTAWVRNVTE